MGTITVVKKRDMDRNNEADEVRSVLVFVILCAFESLFVLLSAPSHIVFPTNAGMSCSEEISLSIAASGTQTPFLHFPG